MTYARFVLIAALALAGAPAAAQPLPEVDASPVGYPTVAAALADLRARPEVAFSTQNGWLVGLDNATRTIWSFSPEGSPAHPAVIKRQLVRRGDRAVIDMRVLCQAEKQPCDDLVRTFSAMNRSLGQPK